MKAYIKNIKGRCPLTRTRLAIALQYALFGLSIVSYAHAQQTSPEPAKAEKSEKKAPPTVGDLQQPATAESADSKEKAAPVAGDTQQAAETSKPEETVLPTMVIKDKGPEKTSYVAKRSLTGTKTDTPMIEIPQSISVVTREEMDARAVTSMTEALRYVPGVVVDNYGFEARGYEYLLMRGFQSLTTAMFRDGLSMAAQGLYFGSFITEPYGLERIDVLRGPASVLFGRGDAGGIVNRVSKLPSANPIRELQFQYGNFDLKRIAGDIGFANADGTLMFRLVGLGLDTDTQVKFANGERSSIERLYLAPSLTWLPSGNTSITLLADILQNRAGASPFYVTAPNGTPTDVLISDPKFTRYKTNQASAGYRIEHHFNETWTARQNFRYMWQDGNFREINPGFHPDTGTRFAPDGRTILRDAFRTREHLDQTVLDTHLQARVRTGRAHHTILTGVDWNRTDATLLYYASASTPSIDLFNPIYPQFIPTPNILGADFKQRVNQVGVYVQDQIKFDERWVVTLGGRHDWVSSQSTDTVNPSSNDSQNDNAFTGRAGLTYLFPNGIAPYISYAQSFLPQPGRDIVTGNTFNPTRGTLYEIGIKFQPVGGKGLYTVAFFDLTKTNVLTPDLSQLGRLVERGEIGSRGVELEARTELFRGLNAIGAFTYNDVTVTKSNEGDLNNMPIQIPKLFTSLWLDYSLAAWGNEWLRGFGIGGGVRYVGRRYNDSENTSSQPSFTLFDAMVRYDYGRWRFAVNASNLFNEEYLSSRSTSVGGAAYRGLERTVLGTLKFRF
jgi:iron complex outermembrane receptor protein